jgi:hypothetical protein
MARSLENADASNDAGITCAIPSQRTKRHSHSAAGAMNGAGSSEGGGVRERRGKGGKEGRGQRVREVWASESIRGVEWPSQRLVVGYWVLGLAALCCVAATRAAE